MVKTLIKTLRPPSSAVKDGQNFNLIASHTVGDDIGRAAYNELAGSAHAALSADVGIICAISEATLRTEDRLRIQNRNDLLMTETFRQHSENIVKMPINDNM